MKAKFSSYEEAFDFLKAVTNENGIASFVEDTNLLAPMRAYSHDCSVFLARNVKRQGIPNVKSDEEALMLIDEALKDLSDRLPEGEEMVVAGRMGGWMGFSVEQAVRFIWENLYLTEKGFEEFSYYTTTGDVRGNDISAFVAVEGTSKEFLSFLNAWDGHIARLEQIGKRKLYIVEFDSCFKAHCRVWATSEEDAKKIFKKAEEEGTFSECSDAWIDDNKNPEYRPTSIYEDTGRYWRQEDNTAINEEDEED